MNTQEIISEIQKLLFIERKKILSSLQNESVETMREEEVQKILFAEGVIGNLPDPSAYTDDDDDFEPIEIESGEPVSETIIKERRPWRLILPIRAAWSNALSAKQVRALLLVLSNLPMVTQSILRV